MWKAKSGDYMDGNLPEAIAQTQKGIVQQIKFIDGQRQAGIPVPPLKSHVAEAMEILSDPKNATAEPDTIRQVDADIRSINKADGTPAFPGGIREAMEKIPEQNRVLDMAIRARAVPTPTEEPPVEIHPVEPIPEVPSYTPLEEGPLVSDANRSSMRAAPSPPSTSEPLPEIIPQSGIDNDPVDPHELEERIRKLDEERARLARQIAERKKQSEGEQS
jgi:hypothetical protein